jgi:hypothetical protein
MLVQAFFGWPAMLLSLGFAVTGVVWKRTTLSIIGAILFLLPGWYLAHYALFFALVPLCLIGSAYANWKTKYGLASWLLVPQWIVLIALAIVVFTQ